MEHRERWTRVAIIAVAFLFALGTSVLSWDNARERHVAPRFHWPDETTNWYFADRVARGESLAVAEPRNIAAGNLIHPRTANVRADGAMIPGAYLGLPLAYGVLGRVFGVRAMLFFTPILAGLGLLAFARIVAALWDRHVALVATVLLALHGTFWLFTATAFLPNVPFVALLLMGVSVLVRNAHPPSPPLPPGVGEQEGVWRALFGGLLIGIALTMRTHEVLWVAALALAFAWHERASWAHVLAAALGAVLPFVPILALNAQLYGSPFTTGYALLHAGGALPTEFSGSGGLLSALVAPFGWHLTDALERFWEYMVLPYAWFFALVVVGLTSVFFGRRLSPPAPPPHCMGRGGIERQGGPALMPLVLMGRGGMEGRGPALVTMALVVWLIMYYGSWMLADPLVRETNVLTISYARYWLPVVVLLAPWAGAGFLAVMQRCGRWRFVVAGLMTFALALTSVQQIVADPVEGLTRQRAALAEHRERARAVIAATPDDAVIVSHRMDKVFFPERAVVFASEVPDADVLRRLRGLVERAPVYWYAPSRPAVEGFSFTPMGAMPFNEHLHRVEKL